MLCALLPCWKLMFRFSSSSIIILLANLPWRLRSPMRLMKICLFRKSFNYTSFFSGQACLSTGKKGSSSRFAKTTPSFELVLLSRSKAALLLLHCGARDAHITQGAAYYDCFHFYFEGVDRYETTSAAPFASLRRLRGHTQGTWYLFWEKDVDKLRLWSSDNSQTKRNCWRNESWSMMAASIEGVSNPADVIAGKKQTIAKILLEVLDQNGGIAGII